MHNLSEEQALLIQKLVNVLAIEKKHNIFKMIQLMLEEDIEKKEPTNRILKDYTIGVQGDISREEIYDYL